MQRYKKGILICLVCIMAFMPVSAMALRVTHTGEISTLITLRDVDGFQYGFLNDYNEFCAVRSTLKLNLNIIPEYAIKPDLRFDKAFLSYRGGYDAIFDLTDRYNSAPVNVDRDNFDASRDGRRFENDLREITVDFLYETQDSLFKMRLGRQLVQWGESTGFRITNVVNPADYRNSPGFTNPEDTAVPLWMARFEASKMRVGPFDQLSLQLLVIPEISPRRMAIGNDPDPNTSPFGLPYGQALAAFGAYGFTAVREVVPSSGTENMETGVRVAMDIGQLHTELYYFNGHQDEQAMDFTEMFLDLMADGVLDGGNTMYWRHPKQVTAGFSGNYYSDWARGIFTFDGAYTDVITVRDVGGPLAGLKGYVPYGQWQGLIGFDRPWHFEKIFRTKSAQSSSYQVYYRKIAGFDGQTATCAKEKDYWRLTWLLRTDYNNGRVMPTMLLMYEPTGILITQLSVKVTRGPWYFTLAQSSVWGNPSAGAADYAAYIPGSELAFTIGYNF
ncbi:MAG: DUF1302 family protein [Desulfobacterales bacterium]|nr:DUF1302 family protein [Desulfobacteraceae bacterium]MBT4364597.1 DUF1302 family protein [Desulfobacteraceae bacterium]MBT7697381.1 DUF1302 family protein [Desulfobacterales bacterium]